MKIEEAWEKLAWEEAECFHERSGATDRDHVATKARVLALAVLEECEWIASTDKSCEELRTIEIRWPRIRERIEELGQ